MTATGDDYLQLMSLILKEQRPIRHILHKVIDVHVFYINVDNDTPKYYKLIIYRERGGMQSVYTGKTMIFSTLIIVKL